MQVIKRVIDEHRAAGRYDIKRALREAYPFGERKYHPYRVWLSEVKRQLIRNQIIPASVNQRRKAADPEPGKQINLF